MQKLSQVWMSGGRVCSTIADLGCSSSARSFVPCTNIQGQSTGTTHGHAPVKRNRACNMQPLLPRLRTCSGIGGRHSARSSRQLSGVLLVDPGRAPQVANQTHARYRCTACSQHVMYGVLKRYHACLCLPAWSQQQRPQALNNGNGSSNGVYANGTSSSNGSHANGHSNNGSGDNVGVAPSNSMQLLSPHDEPGLTLPYDSASPGSWADPQPTPGSSNREGPLYAAGTMPGGDADGDLAAAMQMVAEIRDVSPGSSGTEGLAAGVLSKSAAEGARNQPHGQVVPTASQVSRLEYGPGGALVRGAVATSSVVFIVPVTSVDLAVTDTVSREGVADWSTREGRQRKKGQCWVCGFAHQHCGGCVSVAWQSKWRLPPVVLHPRFRCMTRS